MAPSGTLTVCLPQLSVVCQRKATSAFECALRSIMKRAFKSAGTGGWPVPLECEPDGGPARSVGSLRAGRRSSAVRRVAPGWQTAVQRGPSGRPGLADGGPARSIGSLPAGRRWSSAVRRVAPGWQTAVQRGLSGRCGLAGGGPARSVGSPRAGRLCLAADPGAADGAQRSVWRRRYWFTGPEPHPKSVCTTQPGGAVIRETLKYCPGHRLG